ncbi:winged helix-turn-helix domain-containing protein [Thalassomonas viridans]|uniref:Winged helix-turn-helix domain-containing protein n=2 Tax=Thalassomonas viridans TaxID=137584 RepID=A0AAE9Z838_9GAMM|nr:winged helix-turn-helix domain-containing protein [Thalassomonas viridans]
MASLLQSYFQGFGFDVNIISCGDDAAGQILANPPSVVILDLMLPGQDGLSICRSIREKYSGKILILTATGDDMDQVAALEMGADDFVHKPIQPRVLLARVRMLLRRQDNAPQAKPDAQTSDKVLEFGRLWVNSSLQRCRLGEEVVPLTPSEFSILWALASRAETVLSREQLLQVLSGLEYDGLNRTVDNKIAQLRKKLKDDASRPKGIITVRGKGYLFVPDYW